MTSFFLLILKYFRKTGRNFRKFHFFLKCIKAHFLQDSKMCCLVYLQHWKLLSGQKIILRKVYAKKFNILPILTKKVPLNSQAFLGIRICDKNKLSTRAHHLNNTKI